ncbi:MAG: hypothetical protein E5V74_15555, partial [Mesorhizobium sp.]
MGKAFCSAQAKVRLVGLILVACVAMFFLFGSGRHASIGSMLVAAAMAGFGCLAMFRARGDVVQDVAQSVVDAAHSRTVT